MLPLIPMPSPEDRPQLKYSSRYMTDIPRWLKVGAALAVVNFFVTCWLLWQQESPNIRHFYYFAFKHPAPFTAADHQRGDLGSKVVLIEYGDFQCPYCRALHKTLIDLQGSHRWLWVYRNYPLSYHDHAGLLAESAECAGAQGKFWQMGDALYAEPPANPDPASLARLAGSLGLDEAKFDACMTGPEVKLLVEQQRQAGDALGIYGTPTFFINGIRFTGVLPPAQLEDIFKRFGS